ncbi:MAG: hypothetical protein WCF24_09775 [Acidimicrobiales bacterium]
MIGKRGVQVGIAAMAIAGSSFVAFAGTASAAPSQRFVNAQKKLEQQLANRVTQLGRLSADISSAKLAPPHAVVLSNAVSAASGNIDALVLKVPNDDTWAALRGDQQSMYRANRVYAVITPQVFQTIEADAIAAQVTTFEANEATLQSSVNDLVGQPGYRNALIHFEAFVKSVNVAASDSSRVDAAVLAQVPADYPGDTSVFVHANRELLNADLALAHAAYDETVIGLASGGYTGS